MLFTLAVALQKAAIFSRSEPIGDDPDQEADHPGDQRNHKSNRKAEKPVWIGHLSTTHPGQDDY